MQRNAWLQGIAVALLMGVALIALGTAASVLGQPLPSPTPHVVPPLKAPEDHQPTPVVVTSQIQPQSGGVKAVAIVGEVGDHTQSFKDDMQHAVDALEAHGVTVHTFFYGDHEFGWSDIVAAANGAHFLLYMGHGIYWGGPCANPTEVGGFYLGSEYVSPDQIRNDLGGKLADDSVVILSHACFSAGDTACDSQDTLTQAEAERRVRMYAAPFVDIGMEAYYANNYYYSAKNTVNLLLADFDQRKSAGEVFKSVYPFNANEFRDLTYPTAGYDLWLSGSTGHWSDAFVGIPDYVFAGDQESVPELGGLPDRLEFTYNTVTGETTPDNEVIVPTNVGTGDPLTWQITKGDSWFNITPTEGQSPDDVVTVEPSGTSVHTLSSGQHTDAVTMTVTDPAGTLNAIQRVDVILDVVTPRLGNLPAELTYTYFISDTQMFPQSHVVTPRNVGSNDVLTWELDQAGTWFDASVTGGMTPDAFTLTPISYTTAQSMTYTGSVTVTVTSPTGIDDAVQRIDLTLEVKADRANRVYLPLVSRN